MADLLDFGVSGVSKPLTDRFSVDLLSAASRSKAQRTKPWYSTQNLNYGGRWVTKLTVWGAHDGLFDHITAGNSLLKALGALLQEPLSCCHLQLPANTVITVEGMQQCLFKNDKPTTPPGWLIPRCLTSECQQSSQRSDRKCFVTCFMVILSKAERMKLERLTALFTKRKTVSRPHQLVFITE